MTKKWKEGTLNAIVGCNAFREQEKLNKWQLQREKVTLERKYA